MNYKVNDVKKELEEVFIAMQPGDTAEVEYTLPNVARVRMLASAINKSYTVSNGNRKYRTSTFRRDAGIVDIYRIE